MNRTHHSHQTHHKMPIPMTGSAEVLATNLLLQNIPLLDDEFDEFYVDDVHLGASEDGTMIQ